MRETSMTCADCDELFLDWFEGDLDATKRASVDLHVSSCARCQGLIRDVDGIRETAGALPDLSPSRDLWQGIEARIQPRVVSIGTSPRRTGIPRVWMAAAAAALIVVSSSVTYVATSRTIGNGKKPAASAVATTPPVRVAGATVEAQPEPPPVAQEPAPATLRQVSLRSAPLSERRPFASRSVSEVALAGEIGRLQTLLRQRRDQLEPATLRIVEDNLAIIDAAVSQARSALANDPASGFLNERLEGALQKKVELLRTVALLRSST